MPIVFRDAAEAAKGLWDKGEDAKGRIRSLQSCQAATT